MSACTTHPTLPCTPVGWFVERYSNTDCDHRTCLYISYQFCDSEPFKQSSPVLVSFIDEVQDDGSQATQASTLQNVRDYFLKNRPVVQRGNNSNQWITHYPANKVYQLQCILVALPSYPLFEQLGPVCRTDGLRRDNKSFNFFSFDKVT